MARGEGGIREQQQQQQQLQQQQQQLQEEKEEGEEQGQRQLFLDTVTSVLLGVVGGKGPFVWLAAREGGQASAVNAFKVQAWQALCLLSNRL